MPDTNEIDFASPWGYVGLLAAVTFFGSFNVLMKSPAVVKANVDPMVFQLYYSFTVAVFSCATLTYNDFHFSWWPIVGAIDWVLSSLVAYLTVHLVGVAFGPLVWSGVTIVVSFLWGQLWFGEPMQNIYLAMVALFVVFVGLVGAGVASTNVPKQVLARLVGGSRSNEGGLMMAEGNDPMEELLFDASDMNGEGGTDFHTISTFVEKEQGKTKSRFTFVLGMSLAVLMGAMNGSLMVPFKYYVQELEEKGISGNQDLSYVAMFAIGVFVCTPIIGAVYFTLLLKKPVLHWRVVTIPGVYTGFMWAIGNVGSVYATKYLGNSVGYPLTQCAVLINGLWGVLWYREITGFLGISLFMISSFVMLAGAALLVYSAAH